MELPLLILKYSVTALYLTAFVFLCSFGLHKYYLSLLYEKKGGKTPKPKARFETLPSVTVQLPVYNEMYVVERVIKAACAIDYPRELLHIQALDDSTDETTSIARRTVDRFRALGFDIELIHRDNREGYKAGALAEGMKTAKGELIAIFDADFLPPADFLRKTVDFFTDPGVGIVQARWGHLNRNYSTLTNVQAILLDGHFIVEQTARFANGVFFNFNGTAGVIRKSCIESAGGWLHDTLTEDLDLSYRAQMKGWRMIYLKDLVAPAELPVDINAFKTQQHRWTKGAVQTAMKLLPSILRSPDLSLKVKTEAAFHLLGGFTYLLLLVLIAFMVPVSLYWSSIGWEKLAAFNALALFSGFGGLLKFYSLALKEHYGRGWVRRIPHMLLAIAVGTGLAVNNAIAVLEALLGKQSEFRRTPKFAVTAKGDGWRSKGYVTPRSFTPAIEFGLALFFTAQTVVAALTGHLSWIPILLLILLGFLYTSAMSFFHGMRA